MGEAMVGPVDHSERHAKEQRAHSAAIISVRTYCRACLRANPAPTMAEVETRGVGHGDGSSSRP